MPYYSTADLRKRAEAIAKNSFAEAETSGISTKWFQQLPEDKQKELAAVIRNSNTVLETLKGILVREYEELSKEKLQDYDNPNWHLKQADKVGYKRAIQNFITLLTITE